MLFLFFPLIQGPDITKNDGVYSSYFTHFTTEGFYGIKINVRNNGTAIVVGPGPYASVDIPNLDQDNAHKLIGTFSAHSAPPG